LSIPTELWQLMLEWQFLLAVFAVSFVTGFVCCLWLLRPRRRPRRVADRQSRRRESAARHLRPGARPDAIARAPAENGKKGDKQECKEDIQRPRRRVETSSQGAPSAQAGGAQALSEAAGHTQAQARQRTERMENLKKTHANLLNILIELAHTAKLCTCTSCKAGKRAADVVSQGAHEVRSPSAASVFRESSDLVNHLASTSLGCLQCVEGVAQGDEARDSSPVASSSASGPYRRSSPQVSSSAAGSAAFGAARRKGETTSLLPWGSTAPARARSGASSYSTKPTKTQRMRISGGALFDTRIVRAQIKKYASPKECPEQQPAAASGFRTRTSRHQTPTVIKRNNFSSGGHRNRGSVSVEIPAEPRPQAATGPRSIESLIAWSDRWHSTGDLRPRHQAPQTLAARGDIDIEDPVPQTPLPPQRR
jgi:hypothetical protein